MPIVYLIGLFVAITTSCKQEEIATENLASTKHVIEDYENQILNITEVNQLVSDTHITIITDLNTDRTIVAEKGVIRELL